MPLEAYLKIMDLVSRLMSYKVVDVMDVCDRCGIFDKLTDGPATAEGLSKALDLQPVHLQVLLDFGRRAGLLDRNADGRYGLSKPTRQHLPLIRLELWAKRWHMENDSLFKVLKTGQRCDPMNGDVSGMRHIYDGAMSEAARLIAVNIARAPDVDGSVVVDLGGSDGALGEALLKSKVARHVRVCDRTTAQQGFQRRLQARPDLSETLCFHSVDLLQPATLVEPLSGASLVLMSNVIHLLAEAERRAVYAAIREHAGKRVCLVIYDQFLADREASDADMTAPDLMVIDWLKCGVPFDHSAAQISEEVSQHGFATTLKSAAGLPGRFVFARAIN